MKIAFVFDDCMRQGGVERVIHILSNYFVSKFNYSVEIINYNKKTEIDYYKYGENIKVTNLEIFKKSKNPALKYLNKRNGIKKLKKYLLENEYDIILSMAAVTNILLAKISKDLKSRIIGTEHTQYNGHSLKTMIRRKLYYKRLDELVVLTDEDYERYKKYFGKTLKIAKIYNPVSEKFKFNRYNLETKKILTAGRLSHIKGFDMLIKSMPKVIKRYPEWKLEIIGEGSEHKALENEIKKEKMENSICIKGFVNNLEEIMDEFSFFVMSSRNEGFGLVLAEAQAKGLPTVSFDCKTGPGEIINNGKDGILVEAENVEKLSDAIIKMIEKDKDRIEMSKNAVENARRFSIDKICAQWKELLENPVK